MLGLRVRSKGGKIMSNTGTNINVENDIRELVAEILETEPTEISSDANFVKDLGMDSMMALEVLASIEKKYRIAIPEEALPKFVSLNATVDIVKDILLKK
jgi:acyl carrier protein